MGGNGMIYITLSLICFSILVSGILTYLFGIKWLKYQEDKLVNTEYELLVTRALEEIKNLKERPDYKEELDKMKTQLSNLSLVQGLRGRQ